MINPHVVLGLVVAWISSLGAMGYWQNNAGHAAEKSAWQARENKELTEANSKIFELEQSARAAEARHRFDLSKIADEYEREKTNAGAQKKRDIADARAGVIKLRIPAVCEKSGGSALPGTSSSAGLGDGGATSELPGEIAADLLELANDADAVVKQLRSCQEIVRADRKVGP